ncbi:hypothetical protein GCM10010129_03150 [Streptomyces fumigatiscleroticus]|nr:hypothetical protein GCM10010129_03150 [Streptomyces fumigatiscleroticus]
MRHGGHDTPPGDRDDVLADEVEGYLLARTHHDRAVREAAELCARLPWLTTGQAEDLTRHYLRQRTELTRRMLNGTVERAAQLREEYENRYADLRRALLTRHAVCACAMLACASGVGTLVCLSTR